MPSQVVRGVKSYSAVKWTSVCRENSLTYVVLSRLPSVCLQGDDFLLTPVTLKLSSLLHQPQLSEEIDQEKKFTVEMMCLHGSKVLGLKQETLRTATTKVTAIGFTSS